MTKVFVERTVSYRIGISLAPDVGTEHTPPPLPPKFLAKFQVPRSTLISSIISRTPCRSIVENRTLWKNSLCKIGQPLFTQARSDHPRATSDRTSFIIVASDRSLKDVEIHRSHGDVQLSLIQTVVLSTIGRERWGLASFRG